MNNLEKVKQKKEVLKIDYADKNQIKKYTNEEYKYKFNWTQYISHYKDLKYNNLNDAWHHWTTYGVKEKRHFFLNNSDNIKTKTTDNIKTRTTDNMVNNQNNITRNQNNISKNQNNTQNKPVDTVFKVSKRSHFIKPDDNRVKYDSSVDINLHNSINNIIKNKDNENSSKTKTSKYFFSSDVTRRDPELNNDLYNEKHAEKDAPKKNTIDNEKQNHLNIHYETKVDELTLKINLLRKNNIIYKNIYDGYGLHYYGWKKVINNFIELFSNSDNNQPSFKEQFFFDEWLEKFLIWGDKNEKNFLIQEIEKNSYKIISFIHNPPFLSWYNNEYKMNLNGKIIFNDEYTNNYLFKQLVKYNLDKKISYLYTLSNSHKEYIYNSNKIFKNKVISILHPIEITGQEKTFDYTLFTQNKQILHIGWVLRNFKSFIDFKQPNDFYKTILIKKDFENEWNKISQEYALNNITILKQLNNTEYEKLFVNSCIFLDLEDSVANNILLECIKFNTPVIVRKLPSIIEYLGSDYPLYFETDNELSQLKNPNFFLKKILDANEYLSKMDKTHISIEYFNKKLLYDFKKLYINEESTLTWFCLIDKIDNIDSDIHNVYNNFISQNDNKKIKLKIVINNNLKNKENFGEFILKIEKTCEFMNNIHYFIKDVDNYSDYLNFCIDENDTKYFVFVDILDEYSVNFSNVCKKYMDITPTCDITFTSYSILNNSYQESFLFEKDFMLFHKNLNQTILPERGIIFRKDICKLIGYFNNYIDIPLIFREYASRALKNNLNIMCCESSYINQINKI